MCLYINYNDLLWIHTCIQLALIHQVCASGLGCCGAGCGLSWSWMWVIMVLGVGCRGAGCGLSWSWMWEVLQAVCRTQSPPTLYSSRMPQSSWNPVRLSWEGRRQCDPTLCSSRMPQSSWNPVRLSWEGCRQCNPTLSSGRMHPSSGNFVRLSWEGRRQCNPTLCAAGCPRLLETLSVFLGRVAGNVIQLSAQQDVHVLLKPCPSFLGGSQAMQSNSLQ